MSKLPVELAQKDFVDLINLASIGKERIVIGKHGKPACAIVPIETLKANTMISRYPISQVHFPCQLPRAYKVPR